MRKKRSERNVSEHSGSVEVTGGDRQQQQQRDDGDNNSSSANNEGNWRSSRKHMEEEVDEQGDDREDTSSLKKQCVVWPVELHQQFVAAVNQLGVDKAVPKKITQKFLCILFGSLQYEDFMRGKSGMLAALGLSGSGKTHTVFGTLTDSGVVPLTLRQLFKKRHETYPVSLRSFYLSIFEICSERGKGEKVYDLLGDGSSEFCAAINHQGFKRGADPKFGGSESLIGQVMMKRATATTSNQVRYTETTELEMIVRDRLHLSNICPLRVNLDLRKRSSRPTRP